MRFGYIRVSTPSGEQLSALDGQRQRVQNEGVDFLFEDVQSGRDTDRPGYLRLLDAIRKGRCTEVVVTRLDRLGRDAAEADAFLAYSAKHGCVVRALDGGVVESQTPQGFFLSRLMTSLAEMESRMLSMRIKAGLESRRRLRAPIRATAPWGYRVSEDKLRLEPDPVEFPRARQMVDLLHRNNWRLSQSIRDWRAQGLGPIPLNSGLSLGRWLYNPILRGGIGYHHRTNRTFRETHWGIHTPLLTNGEFESARLQINANRRKWGRTVARVDHLLTGLCRCGHCGGRMIYNGGKDRPPGLLCRGPGCAYGFKATHEAAIVPAVNRALSAHAEQLCQMVATEPPEIERLRQEIARYEEYHDPDLQEAIETKRMRISELRQQPVIDQELLASLRQHEFWEVYSQQELRELYLLLVDHVLIRDRAVADVVFRQ